MIADLMPKLVEQFAGPEQEYRPRPSSAGPDRCIRQMVYHALRYPRKPLAGRALLIFDDSSWHEELTLDLLRKSAYQIHSEQMALELPGILTWKDGEDRWECGVCSKAAGESITIAATSLHGHIDSLFTDVAGVDRLLEHKAINHFTFERYWTGILPHDYLAQVAIYMRALQLLNPELTEWLLLLKNKNTSQFVELIGTYEHARDRLELTMRSRSDGERATVDYVWEGAVAECVDRFRQVETYAGARELPARPHAFGTQFPCGYCPYEESCWRGYAAGVKGRGQVYIAPELEGALAGYVAIAEQEKQLEKEKKAIRAQIVDVAEKNGASMVIAGGMKATINVQERTLFDTSQLPAKTLAEIAYKTTSEVVRVSAAKAPAGTP